MRLLVSVGFTCYFNDSPDFGVRAGRAGLSHYTYGLAKYAERFAHCQSLGKVMATIVGGRSQ